MSKKLKKALGLGLAAVAANKMGLLGGKKDPTTMASEGFGSESKNVSELIKGDSANLSGAIQAAKKAKRTTVPGADAFDPFGGMMQGAKKGGMMKAKTGTMVMARGCKIGKKKPTRIT